MSYIEDPKNVFCGSRDCYEVLGVPRNADANQIGKRKKKPVGGPADLNAQYVKAYKVLSNPETRTLYDHFLDNPHNYHKVASMASPQSYSLSFTFAMTVVAIVLSLVVVNRYSSKRFKRM